MNILAIRGALWSQTHESPTFSLQASSSYLFLSRLYTRNRLWRWFSELHPGASTAATNLKLLLRTELESLIIGIQDTEARSNNPRAIRSPFGLIRYHVAAIVPYLVS